MNQTLYALARAFETAAERTEPMAKLPTPYVKPRVRVKAQGRAVFLGKDFDAAADSAGDIKIKPKRKHRTLQQEYASKNRKKWKAAK